MFLRCASSPISKSLSPELDHWPRIQSQRLIPISLSSTSSFPAGNKFSRTSSDRCTFSERRFPSPMCNEEEDESFADSWSWSGMGEGVEVMPMPTEHYQKMIASYPEDHLILGNYARFSKEVEGDEVERLSLVTLVSKSRRVLRKGHNGGSKRRHVLSQYGDLIWQKDKNSARAKLFFDQAVQSSPDDCYVLAACAKFLWEGGDDENDTTRYSSPSPTMGAPT